MFDSLIKARLKQQLQEHLKEKAALTDDLKKKKEEDVLARLDKLNFKIQYIEDQLKYF